MAICIIDDCEGSTVGRGYCRKHYQRWWKHGDPLHTQRQHRGFAVKVVLDRFNSYKRVNEKGCWIWSGTTSNGYGRLYVGPKTEFAHRWSHENFIGPIPPGYQVDHKCRETLCVNPDHLEAVSPSENLKRRRPHTNKKDPAPARDRFWKRIDVRDGHWFWTAKVDKNGYGVFYAENKTWQAHRWAALYVGGMSIDGLEVDHLCQERSCVNPYHLQPITSAEHHLRTGARRRR
jgi:hypothetical protein